MNNQTEKGFNLSTKPYRMDGWRVWLEPIYAICGWNDTSEDIGSPCKTSVGRIEGEIVKGILRTHNIPFLKKIKPTSNVFCIAHFIIVKPVDYKKAKKLFNSWYNKTGKKETRLLYAVEQNN